eukprot:GHUV01023226.1.p2 GENE.GHUV01023226.1~~GHUV01023226.1.p2  ORF type:complete len:121 (-),score=17.82 GHUV01023226.1:274-636(-)
MKVSGSVAMCHSHAAKVDASRHTQAPSCTSQHRTELMAGSLDTATRNCIHKCATNSLHHSAFHETAKQISVSATHLRVSRSNIALIPCFSFCAISTKAALSCMTLQQPSAVPHPKTAPES